MTAPKVGTLTYTAEQVQDLRRRLRETEAELAAEWAGADALAGALDDVLKCMWHPESAGRPPLDNMDRWRVVEALRDALSAHRARREQGGAL